MMRFDYVRPLSVEDAVRELNHPGSRALAGGTNIVDLMKYDVVTPSRIVDVNRLPLKGVKEDSDGKLRVGALVTNSELAWHEAVQTRFPLLSTAILAGASPQLRNAATTGGNLLQRTRCVYFYDTSTPCNKRHPGSGCSAIGGINRMHAILGASSECIAVHPSDMCVALAVFEADVEVHGPAGPRTIPMAHFHRLPAAEPDQDTTLGNGELVTAILIRPADFGPHYTYIKVRDRLSYAFALISVAVGLVMEGNMIAEARVALGGVAHKPWRDQKAEETLIGRAPERTVFEEFAVKLLSGAQGCGHNDFKIDLARRTIVRALTQAANGTPQDQSHKSIN